MFVESLRIQKIDADRVTVVGRDIGDHHGGTCPGGCCDSSDSNGDFQLVLGQASTASENKLSITVLAIDHGQAVVCLAPVLAS